MGMHLMDLRSLALRLAFVGGLGASALGLPGAPAFSQQASLPNGATSLAETYEDWKLSCALQNNQRACMISQDQLQQNGQRLLAVEIDANAGSTANATFLLPFGILFAQGVTPQIDEAKPLSPVAFRTCLPNGCIATFAVDAATLKRLRAGTSLKLQVTTAAETPLSFTVSLKGLGAALDRLAGIRGS